MELWATGFNAWSQLQFDGELPAQPRDMREFSSVLKDEQIEILRTSISATLGKSEVFSSISFQMALNIQPSTSEWRRFEGGILQMEVSSANHVMYMTVLPVPGSRLNQDKRQDLTILLHA
jgi:hypothetical protein